jgi:uncharacterized protein YicC (UPF0701 family)
LDYKTSEYHRAAAARARKLQGEATTRRLKEQLEDVIAQHAQIAEEIERASEHIAGGLDPGSEKL